MQVKVRDRKTGNERTVTKKAYEIIPHRYDFLGYVDEDGNPIENGQAPQIKTVQKKTQEKSAVPAEAKIEVRPVLTKEDIEQKRAEMDQMNQNAIQNAIKEAPIPQQIPEQAPQPEVKTRRKPGPKPKTHA